MVGFALTIYCEKFDFGKKTSVPRELRGVFFQNLFDAKIYTLGLSCNTPLCGGEEGA